jgi:ABC-2 type transport system ATP-binding protein
MIEVKGLTRHYGTTVAIADVSFTVGRGEVVGFLGPNGAGKSTTMKILTGSLAPSRGTAVVAGHDILDEPLEVRRRVGFMPEHVALYGDQTVASLLNFVADIKHVPPGLQAAQVGRLMDQTGLAEVRDGLVGNLSHGYRKRVGLAQALIGDPDVLVLDEPTSGLDPHQIVEIRELIRSFRGERTVLFSSHILAEVQAICERVLILDRGRLVTGELAAGLATAGDAGAPVGAVVLVWDGAPDGEVVAALQGVAGVREVVPAAGGAEVVLAGDPREIRPQLAAAVQTAGARLQGLQDKGPSLEDLFLRATGRRPGPPAVRDGERP